MAKSMNPQNLDVQMFHARLSTAPTFDCPSQFRIVPYTDGRENDWLRIHQEADFYNTFNEDTFAKQFGVDKKLLADRQFYLIEHDRAIGTASAWLNDSDGRGRVHWVAISPEFQGTGLAKPLLSTVCQTLVRLGHKDAVLSTSTARTAAINLYLQFGFEPLIVAQRDIDGWKHFMQVTGKVLPSLT